MRDSTRTHDLPASLMDRCDSQRAKRFLPLLLVALWTPHASSCGSGGSSESWQSSQSSQSTINVSGCTTSAVTTAINNASNGDTVLLPASCTANWSSGFISTNKGITIDGNGSTITRTGTTTTPLFSITTNTTAMFRLTNMNFYQTQGCCPGSDTDNNVILIDGASTNMKFRIDHCTFTSTTASVFINIRGGQWGLIDHNISNAPNNAEHIHLRGIGQNGWTQDVHPGSDEAVYVEDNVFTNNGTGNANSSLQSYDGMRTVYRYNTMNNTQIDQHGTAGMIGARWFEIYENSFNNPAGPKAIDKFADLRAGSGVVFNNHLVTGSREIILREEDSGTWPLAYQIGSGYDGGTNGHGTCNGGTLNQSPLYLWNNDLPVSVMSGPIQANRDYFTSASQPASMQIKQLSTDTCSTTFLYTPYTYPHPLVTVTDPTNSPPAAPTGLRVN